MPASNAANRLAVGNDMEVIGDLVGCSTLSWWRSVRVSASSEALDRNNPMTAHQISLSKSPMG